MSKIPDFLHQYEALCKNAPDMEEIKSWLTDYWKHKISGFRHIGGLSVALSNGQVRYGIYYTPAHSSVLECYQVMYHSFTDLLVDHDITISSVIDRCR